MLREAAQAAGKIQGLLDMLEKAKVILAAAGCVEQEEADLREKITANRKELAGFTVATDTAKEELAKALESVNEARSTAAGIIATGRAEAAALLDEAKAKNLERSNALLGVVKKTSEDIDAAKAALEQIQSDVNAAKKEYDDLQAQLKALRDDARKRFG